MRLDYIDYAKAFAIICVVAGHVLNYDFYGNYAWTDSPLHRWIYSFHMPLFMFLSGLVSFVSIKRSEVTKDIYKRFRRIIVPGIIIGSIYTLVFFNNLIEFLTHQFKLGYWYLFVLFEYYLINYIPALLSSKRVITVFYLLSIVIWSILNRHLDILPQKINDIFCISQMFKLMPFFFIGNAVKRFKLQNILFSNSAFIISLLVWIFANNFSLLETIPSSFVEYNYVTSHITHYLNDFILVLIDLCKVICIISLCRITIAHTQCNKEILSIGRNTLYVYIFHWFFIRSIVMTCYKEWFVGNASIYFDIVVAFAPTILITIACIYLKELLFKIKPLSNFLFFN